VRIDEISQRYFHGSRKIFPVGFTLTPQSDGYLSYEDVIETERIIEHFRPTHMLSRSKAVFMVDDASMIDYVGGYDDHVYEVEPIGAVKRHNLAWYSEIGMSEIDINDPSIKLAAENYWNGVDYTNERHSLWEYLSPSAKIVKVISD
jgi:hypothetical protein